MTVPTAPKHVCHKPVNYIIFKVLVETESPEKTFVLALIIMYVYLILRHFSPHFTLYWNDFSPKKWCIYFFRFSKLITIRIRHPLTWIEFQDWCTNHQSPTVATR